MGEDLEAMKENLYKGFLEAYEDMIINYLRPIKKEMYLCSAECCEDETTSSDDFMDCVQACHWETGGAYYYISSSLDDFKRRYNTCIGKCESGAGFDPKENDDEGDDGDVTAEELREPSYPDPPNEDPEFYMNDWFEDLDKLDLEYEDEEKPEDKIDYKDRNTCTRLCVESYVKVLNLSMDTMRRDLAATAMAKSDQAGFYYDWSRATDPDNPL